MHPQLTEPAEEAVAIVHAGLKHVLEWLAATEPNPNPTHTPHPMRTVLRYERFTVTDVLRYSVIDGERRARVTFRQYPEEPVTVPASRLRIEVTR